MANQRSKKVLIEYYKKAFRQSKLPCNCNCDQSFSSYAGFNECKKRGRETKPAPSKKHILLIY